MGLFSNWGKKKEEAPKRPELNKIISTKRMTFGEVKTMLEKSNLYFDKKGLEYSKKTPQASYYSLTRGTSNETVVERLHDKTLDAKFNDARSKAKGESNEMLPTEDPRGCWKPPVDFFRVLKLEDRMPGYKSVPEPESKEKINTEPIGVPEKPLDISVGMLSPEEFDERTTALLQEGIQREIEKFNTPPVASEENPDLPWN